MDLSTAPLALVGMFAGMMLWSTSVKIFFGVYAAAKNATLATMLGELTDQKMRKILALLFTASCFWASAFALIAIHLASSNTAGSGWVWFFGGMAMTPLFIWATTMKIVRKIKQQKSQGA